MSFFTDCTNDVPNLQGWAAVNPEAAGGSSDDAFDVAGLVTYENTFVSGGWGGPGGAKTLTLTQTVHGGGTNPRVQIEKDIGGGVYQIQNLLVDVATNGDLTVHSTTAFDGRIIVW